jgi:hypothetical protein
VAFDREEDPGVLAELSMIVLDGMVSKARIGLRDERASIKVSIAVVAIRAQTRRLVGSDLLDGLAGLQVANLSTNRALSAGG